MMHPIDQKVNVALGLGCWFLVFAVAPEARAADWLQFRGPDGQGHAAVEAAPLRWSESEHVVWKVPVEGRGWSSPIVMGGRIWVTTAVETPASEEELRQATERAIVPTNGLQLAGHVTLKALAYDLATGRQVDERTVFEVDDPPLVNPVNSYASPTPVAEPGRLYCDFGSMGTACLDTRSGRILWSRRLVVEHQVGPGSSPILYRNLLILVRDGCDQQYMVALDKTTGETVWKTLRPSLEDRAPMYRKAFSTPLVVRTPGGTDQLVTLAARWIISYDPATGDELWRVDTGKSFSNVSRPVYDDGRVYLCTAFGGTEMLAVRIDGRGDVTDTHVVWRRKQRTPRRSSPLIVGGRVFFVSDRGVASCADAVTGDVLWSERLEGAHSASPVYAAGRVYFFGENGTSTVVQAADAFLKLAENRLAGRIMASPAFVGRVLILRTDTHLYRIESE